MANKYHFGTPMGAPKVAKKRKKPAAPSSPIARKPKEKTKVVKRTGPKVKPTAHRSSAVGQAAAKIRAARKRRMKIDE